jgi:hypothetical protein
MSALWTALAIAIWVSLGAAIALGIAACARRAEDDGEVDE